MNKIKAILFDLDGTLRDSREVIYSSIEHTLVTHTESTPTRQELLPHIHYHLEVHKKFAPHIAEEEFLKTYMDKIDELRATMQPYAGAHDLITRLKQQGYRLAIVTSAGTAADYLANHGVADLFDAIVGGNDVAEHKPSPIPVLRALEIMNVKPEHAVMVGDLGVDIEAAKAAGLAGAIGILHGFGTTKMLEDAGADAIITNYNELEKTIGKLDHE